ncbi:hypothetical protein [Sphingobium aquiterrae]|uniref:hypothetical protein n=1 Tax=Sphingobium aquiterrae TaxID=2038656 RepID=UPI003018E58B
MAVAAGVMLAATAPASARVVDYGLDKTAIEAAAQDQGIEGPFSDTPAPPLYPVTLTEPTAANHIVKVVSIYCQAYKVENPVSALLLQLLAAPPAAPSPMPAATSGLTLHMVKGSTLLRCLGTGEFKNICKNEVKLSAQAQFAAADGSTTTLPLTVSVEREGRVGGFCGNMARYTGIVSREAAIALIAKARTAYEEAVQNRP